MKPKYLARVTLDKYNDCRISGRWKSSPPKGVHTGVTYIEESEQNKWRRTVDECVENMGSHRASITGYGNDYYHIDVADERSLRMLEGILQKEFRRSINRGNTRVIIDTFDLSKLRK